MCALGRSHHIQSESRQAVDALALGRKHGAAGCASGSGGHDFVHHLFESIPFAAIMKEQNHRWTQMNTDFAGELSPTADQGESRKGGRLKNGSLASDARFICVYLRSLWFQ